VQAVEAVSNSSKIHKSAFSWLAVAIRSLGTFSSNMAGTGGGSSEQQQQHMLLPDTVHHQITSEQHIQGWATAESANSSHTLSATYPKVSA
jgi:hypothetical protein